MQGFITDEVEVGSRVGGVKMMICVFWLVVCLTPTSRNSVLKELKL